MTDTNSKGLDAEDVARFIACEVIPYALAMERTRQPASARSVEANEARQRALTKLVRIATDAATSSNASTETMRGGLRVAFAQVSAHLVAGRFAHDVDTATRAALISVGHDPDDAEAFTTLRAALVTEMDDACSAIPNNSHDVAEWSEAFAAFLERYGDAGKPYAASVRTNAAKYSNDESPSKQWGLWAGVSESDGSARVPRTLAEVLWRARVREHVSARELRVELVERDGDRYAKLPKIVPPISWAMGAPAMRAVDLDGDRYAPEPTLTTQLVPRSWKLLPEDHARLPHQSVLPIDVGDVEALPIAVAHSQGFVISPAAAKLALLLLASDDVRRGALAKSTVEDLTRWTRPGAKRIQPRDMEATATALEELRGLCLFLPDGTKVQIFDVQTPRTAATARADMVLHYGITGTFRLALQHAAEGAFSGPALRGNEFRGEFLVNLTGAMKTDNRRPTLLRHYIRAAAHWNAAFRFSRPGEFDASKLAAKPLSHWATLANTLPFGVVEYLRSKGASKTSTKRAALSKELKAVAADFDELEAMGLVIVEKRGDAYRLLPPKPYLEAKRMARGEGFRPSDEPDGPA